MIYDEFSQIGYFIGVKFCLVIDCKVVARLMSIHRSMDTLLNNLSSYFTRNSSIGCIYDSLLKLEILQIWSFSSTRVGGWVGGNCSCASGDGFKGIHECHCPY